jgi:hypothetical protein
MAAIVAGDILFKGSVVAAAGNTTANANPNTWLGDQISTTAWAGGALNDLFDDISGAENAASTIDYRGLFIHNNNGANTYQNAVIYISAETAGGASIAVAVDTVAISAIGSASTQMTTIANETTSPGGGAGAFSSPTTAGTGLALGSIPIAQCKGFWVRRTAANTAALSADGVTIAVSGDTGSL